MSSIINTIKTCYENFPMSYWAIISGIFGFLFILVASILHSITEPVSFFVHWVSHLGWGPNGSEPVFRGGIIVLGCLLVPYVIFLTRYLWTERKEDKTGFAKFLVPSAFISAGIALIGLFLVSIFGNIAQVGFSLHLLGAVTFFTMTTVLIFLYTASLILCGKKNKIQLLCTVLVVVTFVSSLISATPLVINYTVIELLNNFTVMSSGERVSFLTSIVPLTAWLTFFEWMIVFSFCSWFIITGMYTLKIERE